MNRYLFVIVLFWNVGLIVRNEESDISINYKKLFVWSLIFFELDVIFVMFIYEYV